MCSIPDTTIRMFRQERRPGPCLASVLTAVILDEPQVRELGTHVTHNTVQRTRLGPELTGQLLLEGCLARGKPRRRVAGMQGRGRCLHRRHDENEPAKGRRHTVQKMELQKALEVSIFTSPRHYVHSEAPSPSTRSHSALPTSQ